MHQKLVFKMDIKYIVLFIILFIFTVIGVVESWVDFSLFTPVSVAPDARRKGKIENILPAAVYSVEESFQSQYAIKHSITNPFFDRLIQCYLRLPTSAIYQLYPQYQVPLENIYFLEGTTPFRECGIYITPVTMEQDGNYEMFSYAESARTGQTYLTRQKFTVKVFEVEITTRGTSTSTSSSTTTTTTTSSTTSKSSSTPRKVINLNIKGIKNHRPKKTKKRGSSDTILYEPI